MKLAIMQPYFFPYIGYWQLINTVDRFIVYDNVNYIIRGWINRNRILINGEPAYITIPLRQASSSRRIRDTFLQASTLWRNKMVKKIEMAYRRAPYFAEVYPLIEKIILHEADSLSDYLVYQLQTLVAFMGINTELVVLKDRCENDRLSGQMRILDICKREGATTYINPQGGQLLYDSKTFRRAGIDLRFIAMHSVPYKQRTADFIPYLSIIDVLMEMGTLEIMHHLDEFDLITGAELRGILHREAGNNERYGVKQ